jgi:hypothetical protein
VRHLQQHFPDLLDIHAFEYRCALAGLRVWFALLFELGGSSRSLRCSSSGFAMRAGNGLTAAFGSRMFARSGLESGPATVALLRAGTLHALLG